MPKFEDLTGKNSSWSVNGDQDDKGIRIKRTVNYR